MANIYKGVGVNWGVGSIGATAFGTFKMQSNDFSKKSEMKTVQDGDGVTVGKIYFDPTTESTFTYIATAATGSGTATIASPAIGDMITVTDSAYTALADTHWLVDDVGVARSNTDAAKVTVKVTNYPQITS